MVRDIYKAQKGQRKGGAEGANASFNSFFLEIKKFAAIALVLLISLDPYAALAQCSVPKFLKNQLGI